MTYQWNPCNPGPVYTFAVDWSGDGDFTDSGDDVSHDVLGQGITVEYGREQNRQLSPTAIGRAAFSVCNASRDYSPENSGSPLAGNLLPARPVQFTATFQGTTYPLASMRLDDFDIQADRNQRTVSFTALDGLDQLQQTTLSTAVYASQRTGDLIGIVLDAAGWSAGRDIDPGASVVPWWWLEGVNAFDAIQDLVKSEGPPAIGYVAPDGTFVFRDRHHRILRTTSLVSQASFAAGLVDCSSAPVTGLDYVAPFTYQHGWKDIVNSVVFSVDQRVPDPVLSTVWSSPDTYSLDAGQSVTVDVQATDPFVDVETVNVRVISAVTLTARINRFSGQSVRLTFTATGGAAVFDTVELVARSLPVQRTFKITADDSVSIAAHGRKEYPNAAPWASVEDARAIAAVVLAHYAQRRPTVQMQVAAQDPTHLVQVLSRTISDRITIRNDELGLNDDFHIESVSHTIQRTNPDKGPVHQVTFGCERRLHPSSDNPFTFDKTGAGFNDGFFGVDGLDDPGTVFIFDHATQGKFGTGLFGT